MIAATSVRYCRFLVLCGCGAIGLVTAGCACHRANPYAAIGVNRPSLDEAMENASNEVWRVIDLEFHDTASGGYYSFGFSPESPNNPDYNAQVGTVAASALVGEGPPERALSPADVRTSVIIVRRGSIAVPPPVVEFGPSEAGPGHRRPHGHDEAPGTQETPAINTGKSPASPA